MATEQFSNDPGTTLSGAITATRPVTFSVGSGAGWPAVPQFRVVFGTAGNSDTVLVTAVNGGNSYTGTSVEGATAQAWPVGTAVTHVLTAGALAQLKTDAVSASPVWSKVTIGFAALSAAAATNTVTLLTLTARVIVCGLAIKHTTAFTGTGLTALTCTVGDSNNTTTFYSDTPFSLTQAVSNTAFLISNVLAAASFAGGTVQATFTSTGANLSALTAGSVDFLISVATLP
jgi:hypothetical protein